MGRGRDGGAGAGARAGRVKTQAGQGGIEEIRQETSVYRKHLLRLEQVLDVAHGLGDDFLEDGPQTVPRGFVLGRRGAHDHRLGLERQNVLPLVWERSFHEPSPLRSQHVDVGLKSLLHVWVGAVVRKAHQEKARRLAPVLDCHSQ